MELSKESELFLCLLQAGFEQMPVLGKIFRMRIGWALQGAPLDSAEPGETDGDSGEHETGCGHAKKARMNDEGEKDAPGEHDPSEWSRDRGPLGRSLTGVLVPRCTRLNNKPTPDAILRVTEHAPAQRLELLELLSEKRDRRRVHLIATFSAVVHAPDGTAPIDHEDGWYEDDASNERDRAPATRTLDRVRCRGVEPSHVLSLFNRAISAGGEGAAPEILPCHQSSMGRG